MNADLLWPPSTDKDLGIPMPAIWVRPIPIPIGIISVIVAMFGFPIIINVPIPTSVQVLFPIPLAVSAVMRGMPVTVSFLVIIHRGRSWGMVLGGMVHWGMGFGRQRLVGHWCWGVSGHRFRHRHRFWGWWRGHICGFHWMRFRWGWRWWGHIFVTDIVIGCTEPMNVNSCGTVLVLDLSTVSVTETLL